MRSFNIGKFIYVDNAATTKLDSDAFNAMQPYFIDEYGNASARYRFSKLSKKALQESRSVIAKCINAKPNEIYFTSGGSESDNWAIKGVMLSSINTSKNEFITSEIEHHAVLNSAKFISKMGYNVNLIKPSSEGIIYPDELKKLISDKTKLVSVMLANNEIGTIEPIKELAKIAHEKGAVFHTDAVQAVGHIKIDVKDLGIDLLSASAHKFNGPKGIGFLYVKENTGIEQYIHGGAQENGMRAGTENIPAIVGMACSLQKNCNSIEKNFEYVKKLEKSLLDKLACVSNIEYIKNGSKNTLPGNISLSFKNKSGEAILHRLDLKNICVSTSSACDSKNTKISHVLKSIGIPENYATGTIRISLGKYNTQEEIDSIVRELIKICKC